MTVPIPPSPDLPGQRGGQNEAGEELSDEQLAEGRRLVSVWRAFPSAAGPLTDAGAWLMDHADALLDAASLRPVGPGLTPEEGQAQEADWYGLTDLAEGRKLRNDAETWGRGYDQPRSAHYPWARWLDEHADELLGAADRLSGDTNRSEPGSDPVIPGLTPEQEAQIKACELALRDGWYVQPPIESDVRELLAIIASLAGSDPDGRRGERTEAVEEALAERLRHDRDCPKSPLHDTCNCGMTECTCALSAGPAVPPEPETLIETNGEPT